MTNLNTPVAHFEMGNALRKTLHAVISRMIATRLKATFDGYRGHVGQEHATTGQRLHRLKALTIVPSSRTSDGTSCWIAGQDHCFCFRAHA